MGTDTQRQGALRRLRPLAYSAATMAAIGLLFHPMPASAAPQVPPPAAPAVPDAGVRPAPLGTLVLPGQQARTPGTTAPVITPSGVPTSPLLAKIEKQRVEVDRLGMQLIEVKQERELAQTQVVTAQQKLADAQATLLLAEQEAATAAANALRAQAALPPGAVGSGLADLDALARMQRGETATEEAAARQLAIVQTMLTSANAEHTSATARATDAASRYDKINATLTKKQSALAKLEQQHRDEITAAEAAQSAEDRRLGEGYLDGAADGRGADPRALAALQFALDQRGDPYVWSEEGPDEYDCSGLMYAAYRSKAAGNFPLQRVSRDQYYQTRNKVVDRYSLLPGDLLFFSSTRSWTGIHHVAMYAGEGKMVEAPRSGLNVRLVPVRWSRLFQATRVYGSVDGPTDKPDLDKPTTKPTPKPTTKPPTTPKPTKSSTSPSNPSNPSSPSSPSDPSDPSSPSNPATTPTPSTSSSEPAGEEPANPPSSSGGTSPDGSESVTSSPPRSTSKPASTSDTSKPAATSNTTSKPAATPKPPSASGSESASAGADDE